MASLSTLIGDVKNTTNIDPQIEHNCMLPLTPKELAEYMPRPSPEEHFKEVQELLLALEASNNELKEKLKAKRVTLRSAIVIPDKEPSHRANKEHVDQEKMIKKSRKHAKDR